jgi:exopolyphosphatase/guanosine-5'-triphosphate,3'-diphosphate pyrophosphatase
MEAPPRIDLEDSVVISLEGQMFAAVDLGSNSFHMIVARYAQGRLEVIDRLREMVQLAAGLDADGNLAQSAWDRALACLARFGQRISGIPIGQVRAVGTNTFRHTQDPRAFLSEAESTLGHPIEIVSGTEEARLIYVGVTHDLAFRGERRLVVDIGGGSTELIIGRGQEPDQLESLAMGCIESSQRFFGNGKITRSAFKDAETAAALELRPVRDAFGRDHWDGVVGSSGTIRAVHRVLLDANWTEGGITRQGIKRLRREMEAAGRTSKLDLPGVPEERKSVFPGGVAILSACLRNLNIDEMQVSDYALREGALHDLIGRVRRQGLREESVRGFAARHRVDEAQGARVSATAVAAFDQVHEAWALAPAHRAMLDWAARLHEVGLSISHSGYHQHGAYLAEHSDLLGFSREEQLVLATLIVGHRRKLTREVFERLPDRLRPPVIRVCVLLRMAVLLHRSRLPQALPPLRWDAGSDALRVSFPRGWLDEHPLTEADLQEEQNYLTRVGLTLTYE